MCSYVLWQYWKVDCYLLLWNICYTLQFYSKMYSWKRVTVTSKVQRQKPECLYGQTKKQASACACDTSAFLVSALTVIIWFQTCTQEFTWTLGGCLFCILPSEESGIENSDFSLLCLGRGLCGRKMKTSFLSAHLILSSLCLKHSQLLSLI